VGPGPVPWRGEAEILRGGIEYSDVEVVLREFELLQLGGYVRIEGRHKNAVLEEAVLVAGEFV